MVTALALAFASAALALSVFASRNAKHAMDGWRQCEKHCTELLDDLKSIAGRYPLEFEAWVRERRKLS